ncbi:MAG: IS200/IS605 family transposase [Bacteroidales bacterium]|nr:IS200/IS605 family transposase [Bacteroidales bacterium]MCD8393404.1 IS200/IS605 family transposase [Bacteroidales bacterium]MCD8393406.1 IS200/IS605 family transposase [Bacteroidales bacterium]
MSYTKLYYHVVWRTLCSEPSIPECSKYQIKNFLAWLCDKYDWHLETANFHLDHAHLLVSVPPNIALSDAVRSLKAESSQAFKRHRDFPLFKGWNSGYGGFTVGHREIPVIRNYIENQSEHHRGEDTRCELMRMLSEHEIFDDQYFEQNW